jgi:hypothetical protein
MKKLLASLRARRVPGSVNLALVVCPGCALALIFWTATAPEVGAREITPAEMIQSKLPHNKTLATANKSEVLSAICGAVRQWQNDVPQIVRTAAGARREIAVDIVKTGIRCLDPESDAKSVAVDPDCNLVEQTVAAGLAVDPEHASNIMELALQLVPACRGAIETVGTPAEGPADIANGPTNIIPISGSGGGAGGFNPQRNSIVICDNGQNVQIPASGKNAYLASHPGARLGVCQASVSVNR